MFWTPLHFLNRSSNSYAAEAGFRVLEEGGNAIDALVVMQYISLSKIMSILTL